MKLLNLHFSFSLPPVASVLLQSFVFAFLGQLLRFSRWF
jgi:hypothetical protein